WSAIRISDNLPDGGARVAIQSDNLVCRARERVPRANDIEIRRERIGRRAEALHKDSSSAGEPASVHTGRIGYPKERAGLRANRVGQATLIGGIEHVSARGRVSSID